MGKNIKVPKCTVTYLVHLEQESGGDENGKIRWNLIKLLNAVMGRLEIILGKEDPHMFYEPYKNGLEWSSLKVQ